MHSVKHSLIRKILVLSLVPLAPTAAAAGPDTSIEISGSSTVYLITEAVTEEFHADRETAYALEIIDEETIE